MRYSLDIDTHAKDLAYPLGYIRTLNTKRCTHIHFVSLSFYTFFAICMIAYDIY